MINPNLTGGGLGKEDLASAPAARIFGYFSRKGRKGAKLAKQKKKKGKRFCK